MLAVANTGCCLSQQNKIGHPARCYRQVMQVPVRSARGILIGSKTCVIVFLGCHFESVSVILTVRERLVYFIKYEVCCVALY